MMTRKFRLRAAFGAALCAGVALLVWGLSAAVIQVAAAGRIYDRATRAVVPYHEVALVLGCNRQVRGGRENLYFRRRIDAAYELFRDGKVETLLVSGDNHAKDYDEPSDMKAALVAKGVPAERIVCDYAGFRTLDSVVRARKVFGQSAFIIVSQPAHLRRAVFLARAFGSRAVGYEAADVTGRHAVKTRIREQFSKVAALFDALVRRKPHFLGPREALPPARLAPHANLPPDVPGQDCVSKAADNIWRYSARGISFAPKRARWSV